MIKFFRNNQPLIAYILIPVALLFMLPIFLSEKTFEFNFLFSEFINQTPLFFHHIFVFLLLLFNANRINIFVAKFLKTKEKNFLASFFYLLLSSVQLFWFGFSNFFIATIFLVPSLTYLLSINHQKSILDLSFRAGFWLGISILFESSVVLLIVFYLFSLFSSRNISFREWFVLLVGVLIPFLFYFAYLLINDLPIVDNNFHFGLTDLLEFLNNSNVFKKGYVFSSMFILLISIYAFRKNWNKSVHYDKISKKTFFIIGVGLLATGLFNSFDKTNDYLAILIFVLATTIPSYFIAFRKERIGNVIINLYVYGVVCLLIVDYFY